MIAPATAPSSGRLSRRRRSPARRMRSSARAQAGASVTAMISRLPSLGARARSGRDRALGPRLSADALLAEVDDLRRIVLGDKRRPGGDDATSARDGAVLLVEREEHDGQVALNVLLLVDREQHLPVAHGLKHLG